MYGWFVRGKTAFRPFKVADDGLIYIGLASDLTRRELMQHLRSDKTGGSSLRRSLGAILKKKLKLVAIPRSASKSDSKRFSHYRFTKDGEARLTKWMHDNLEVGFFECADYALVESALIRDKKPLLCVLAIAVVLLLVDRFVLDRRIDLLPNSVAVLPFANTGAGDETAPDTDALRVHTSARLVNELFPILRAGR